MENIPDYVVGYIENPRETFQCELKPWINPEVHDYDQVKIAKACLAFRNWGGGVLLIGLKNDGTPDNLPDAYDPSAMFTQDSVQAIISRYSSALFEVGVHCTEVEAGQYVISIVVPGGTTTPVLCKKDSRADRDPKVSQGIIYTRTLGANGTISSAPATQDDLEDMVKKCHDNRVADIGGFLRKHLTDENVEVLARKIDTIRQPEAMEEFSASSSTILSNLLDEQEREDS